MDTISVTSRLNIDDFLHKNPLNPHRDRDVVKIHQRIPDWQLFLSLYKQKFQDFMPKSSSKTHNLETRFSKFSGEACPWTPL